MTEGIFRLQRTSMSPQECAVALRALAAAIPRDILVRGLQAEIQNVEREVMERLRATTMSHALAGQVVPGKLAGQSPSGGSRGFRSRLKHRAPLKPPYVAVYSQGAYANGPALRVTLYGMGALLDQGGRTRAHEIAPTYVAAQHLGKRSKAVFGARAGALAGSLRHPVKRAVMHPGSVIRAHRIIETTFQHALPRIVASVERELSQAVES
jgi:hypothetical protein